MADVNIDFYGKLFDDPNITPGIARAANIAKTYGVALIKAKTPVDTGLLKSSWKGTLEGNGIRYTNDAPYAGFVEFGTRKMAARSMMSSSLSDIQSVFIDELYNEIGEELAGEIITDFAKPGYGSAVNNPEPKDKTGLSRRTKITSRKYLFANPSKVLSDRQNGKINQARPLFQKKPYTPSKPVKL